MLISVSAAHHELDHGLEYTAKNRRRIFSSPRKISANTVQITRNMRSERKNWNFPLFKIGQIRVCYTLFADLFRTWAEKSFFSDFQWGTYTQKHRLRQYRIVIRSTVIFAINFWRSHSFEAIWTWKIQYRCINIPREGSAIDVKYALAQQQHTECWLRDAETRVQGGQMHSTAKQN